MFNILKHVRRSFTTKSIPILELLCNRKLLKVSGNDVSDYLQGLITNDIRHLQEHGNCMYAMFLNTKGRVLYDTIIYASTEENTFLIECDAGAIESLLKHLQIYKLRRKINFDNVSDNYTVYALFDPNHLDIKEELDLFKRDINNVYNNLSSSSVKNAKQFKLFNDISIYQDPRIALLGCRIIAPSNKNITDELSKIATITAQNDSTYKWYRYNLGVGEGIADLPPENCFPLESNCDYLHGVSFHKGCYIGQELTARTYHTGMVRKRLMPLFFSKSPTNFSDYNIINKGVNLGKLRGVEKNAGLALLRISKSLSEENIAVGNGVATTQKPIWWPIEAPKEKLNALKNE